MPVSPLIHARSLLLMALASFLGAWLSSALGFQDPPIELLWIPASLILAGCLARGSVCAVSGSVGLLGWALFSGMSAYESMLLVLGSAASPALTAALIRQWGERRQNGSNLVIATRMLLAIMLVHAPLAGLFDTLAHVSLPIAHSRPWQIYLAYTSIQAMSAVVLVRALLALVPDVPGPICPIELTRGSFGAITRTDLALLALLAGTGLGALLAVQAGQLAYARILLIPIFAYSMIAALITSRRSASLILILTALLVIWLRVRMEPFSVDPVYLTNIGQLVLLLLLGGALLHLLGASYAERNAQQRKLEQQALTNEVSGLPNLRALQQSLQLRRSDPQSPGLRLAEIAFSGLISWADIAGRSRLMSLEATIGEHLRALFQDAILVAHIGTGRFVLMLDRLAVGDVQIRERITNRIEGHRLETQPDSPMLRASVGVVDTAGDQSSDAESLLAALSIAQQRAVSSTERFHSLLISAPQIEQYRAELLWTEWVRQALHRGRLRLLAQPIVSAQPSHRLGPSEARLHYEILARLLDDQNCEISPARFLPAIARARLLEQFDRAVIERTLSRLGTDAALRRATHCCSINITGPTLCDAGFPPYLAQQLALHAIDPAMITLEITESDSISSIDEALSNTAELNRIGVSIAVDDFGTGLATFDYLRKFKPQWLKIDGSFVRSIETDALNREIVQSIVRVAHVIGAQTVAEYVESDAIGQQLAALGVDCLQGYAIGKPMPLDDLLLDTSRRRTSNSTHIAERPAASLLTS